MRWDEKYPIKPGSMVPGGEFVFGAEQSAEQPCDQCGRSASWCIGETYWFADNDLWNAVAGGPGGFMCPPCFTAAADKKGYRIGWRAGFVGQVEQEPA